MNVAYVEQVFFYDDTTNRAGSSQITGFRKDGCAFNFSIVDSPYTILFFGCTNLNLYFNTLYSFPVNT